MGATKDAEHLSKRSKNYRHLWNNDTGFMEARREDGSWAGDWAGWTEGDHWAYSLTVMVSPRRPQGRREWDGCACDFQASGDVKYEGYGKSDADNSTTSLGSLS